MPASKPNAGRGTRAPWCPDFIALGGGAWAVAIGRNDVGAREIEKNAVGTSELKNNKTKGKDVDEASLAQVPSALSADSALSASTAGSADTLDGLDSAAFLRPSCPEGTLFHEGACVETASRATAEFNVATTQCLNAQRRLPTVDELQTFRFRVPLSAEEWTSLEWDRDTGPARALSVLANGTTDGNFQNAGGVNPFRCVATWP